MSLKAPVPVREKQHLLGMYAPPACVQLINLVCMVYRACFQLQNAVIKTEIDGGLIELY